MTLMAVQLHSILNDMNKPTDEKINTAFDKAMGDCSPDAMQAAVKDMMENFVSEIKEAFKEGYKLGWDDALKNNTND